MIKNTFALAGKELLVMLKDRGALAVLFLLPLVLASIFGSISSAMISSLEGEEAVSLPAYVVNLDEGAYGGQVVQALQEIEALDIEVVPTVEEANQGVVDGERLAAVVIPAGLSANVDAYEPSRIQVIVDPTQEPYGGLITGVINRVAAEIVLQGEIRYGIRSVLERSGMFDDADPDMLFAIEMQSLGAIMTQLQRLRERPWVAVHSEDLAGVEAQGTYNPFSYTIPAFTVMFAFFLVGTVAQSIWLERERGSFRRLLAAPISRGAIIAGKVLAYMLIACLQVVIFFTVGSAVFDMPLGESPLALILLTLALALTATTLGILVATLSKSSRQADTVGTVLGFVLAGLGGCLYPIHTIEGFVGVLSRLTPHAHALIAFDAVMTAGAGLVDVLPQLGILIGFGVVFFLIGLWRFEFK